MLSALSNQIAEVLIAFFIGSMLPSSIGLIKDGIAKFKYRNLLKYAPGAYDFLDETIALNVPVEDKIREGLRIASDGQIDEAEAAQINGFVTYLVKKFDLQEVVKKAFLK